MAEGGKNPSGPFELDRLRQIIEMMEEHDLREVKLRQGEQSLVLRRGAQEVVSYSAIPAATVPMAAQASPSLSSASGAVVSPAPGSDSDAGLVPIKSPTVGTYYASPSPEDPPFVKVGDRISPKSVVCIIEAMKVFNQIPADVSGVIAKVLCKSGDPVDHGKALFLVRPE